MATGSTAQPKITQKLLLRTLILLIALALLFGGYRYMQEQKGDFNRGDSNAAGTVAALRRSDDGTEAVLIHPDGSVKGTDSYKAGASDRDIAWVPDGKFLFFTSDRSGSTFHVFRWNPAETDAEARTVGNRGRAHPTFPAEDVPDANAKMLLISGGSVQEFDPKTRQTPQLLPPMTSTITSAESDDQQGGSEALFQAMYGNLGTSFRYARYCKQNRYIAAIMLRDGGEVLILQNMTPGSTGKLVKPVPVVAADHIEFDVNSKDGSVVYSAQNFQWPDPSEIPPEFRKGNKISVPFKHVLGVADPDKGPQPPITASRDDKAAFGAPAISPDGSRVIFTVGPYDSSGQSLLPQSLISCPNQPAGGQGSSNLLQGEIYEPSWSKDGSLIAIAMKSKGKRDIFTVHNDGSSPINLTGGSKGDFSYPLINPQVKTN